ncbi:hypothetical protein CU633_07050 [Bacillus sp. V3-13]|uniref:EamA family transporter n=1 Tax=Bacillus sp. V3-13 TaxID=2053728 RepID=UPI000C76C878|nr:EamA family transporter [Bacillus sp. V3-13]PLR78265.1 hypothetical protein CU633_07050 [Bacillus sp. V3-13]
MIKITRIKESIIKNKIGISFILCASFSTALGQMFWKLSEGNINFYVLFGFFLYFLGAVLMIIAYRFGSLSVLHPLLSIGYVFALLLSSLFLGEMITYKEILGILLILVGSVLIGGGED